jgi:uncharacterized protein
MNREANNMPGKFEVYKDKAGKFRWRLTHINGMVIAKSPESYATKTSAVKNIWGTLSKTNGK